MLGMTRDQTEGNKLVLCGSVEQAVALMSALETGVLYHVVHDPQRTDTSPAISGYDAPTGGTRVVRSVAHDDEGLLHTLGFMTRMGCLDAVLELRGEPREERIRTALLQIGFVGGQIALVGATPAFMDGLRATHAVLTRDGRRGPGLDSEIFDAVGQDLGLVCG